MQWSRTLGSGIEQPGLKSCPAPNLAVQHGAGDFTSGGLGYSIHKMETRAAFLCVCVRMCSYVEARSTVPGTEQRL